VLIVANHIIAFFPVKSRTVIYIERTLLGISDDRGGITITQGIFEAG
jgi:hypothetical protein